MIYISNLFIFIGKVKFTFYAILLFPYWVMCHISYNSRILQKTALHKKIKKVVYFTTFFCYGFSLFSVLYSISPNFATHFTMSSAKLLLSKYIYLPLSINLLTVDKSVLVLFYISDLSSYICLVSLLQYIFKIISVNCIVCIYYVI